MRPDLPPGYRMTEKTLVKPATDAFEPSFALDDAIHADVRAIERADQELQRFDVDDASAHRILRDALARNSYGTASIEGNPLTLEQVESLLRAGPTPERVHVPDEREILNHAALMRRIDELTIPSTPADIAALHADLFKGVLDDAGRPKQTPNFVGRAKDRTVVFVPTPPERVEDELTWALDWLHTAPDPPLIRAAVFFHEFQGIHPFRDGNGRVGRLLFHITLHHWGYRGARYAPIDFAFNADRDAYYGALAATERADYDFTPWIRYLLAVVRRTFEEAVRRFLFASDLPARLNDRQLRIAEWFGRLTHGAHERRVKINDVHAAFPHVPKRTLQYDMRALRDADVLEATGEGKATTYRLAPAVRGP